MPNAHDIVLWSPGDPLPDDGVERWTAMPGFESAYLISTHGRVMRILGGRGCRPGKILKNSPNKDGYATVRLCVNRTPKTVNLHKLVARAFFGPPPADIAGDFEVHHKNFDRFDCSAKNLQYSSAFDNQMEKQHRYYKGQRISKAVS